MEELIKLVKEQDAAIVESWIVSAETREVKAMLQRISNDIRKSSYEPPDAPETPGE